MANVIQVNKKIRMSSWESIRFQVLTFCFIHDIKIADGELECLSLLAMTGDTELNSFCEKVASTTPKGSQAQKGSAGEWLEKRIYASPQVARNALTKLEAKGLVVKTSGKSKKMVSINPVIPILSDMDRNILLNYQIMVIAA